jgi:hypothetical protein
MTNGKGRGGTPTRTNLLSRQDVMAQSLATDALLHLRWEWLGCSRGSKASELMWPLSDGHAHRGRPVKIQSATFVSDPPDLYQYDLDHRVTVIAREADRIFTLPPQNDWPALM